MNLLEKFNGIRNYQQWVIRLPEQKSIECGNVLNDNQNNNIGGSIVKKIMKSILSVLCVSMLFATTALANNNTTERDIKVGEVIQSQIFLPAALNPAGIDGYVTDDLIYAEYMQKLGYAPGNELTVGETKYTILDNYYLLAIEKVDAAKAEIKVMPRGTSIPTAKGNGFESGSYYMTNYIYNNYKHNTSANWLMVYFYPTSTHKIEVHAMDARNNEAMQISSMSFSKDVPTYVFLGIYPNQDCYIKFVNKTSGTYVESTYNVSPDWN